MRFTVFLFLLFLFSGCSLVQRDFSVDRSKSLLSPKEVLKNRDILFYKTEIKHDFADDNYFKKRGFSRKEIVKKLLDNSYYVYDDIGKVLYIQIKGNDKYNSYYANGLFSLTKINDFIYFFVESYDLPYIYTEDMNDLKKNLKFEERIRNYKFRVVRPEEVGYKVYYKILKVEGVLRNYMRRWVYRATILFETLDYRKVIKRYKKAISNYDFSILKDEDRVSMRDFLQKYFNRALLKADTLAKINALKRIAKYGDLYLNRNILRKKMLPINNRVYLSKHYRYFLQKASRKELYSYLHQRERLYGVDRKMLAKVKERFVYLQKKYLKKQQQIKEQQLLEKKGLIERSYNMAIKSKNMEKLQTFISRYNSVELAQEYVKKAKEVYKKLLLEGE